MSRKVKMKGGQRFRVCALDLLLLESLQQRFRVCALDLLLLESLLVNHEEEWRQPLRAKPGP